MDQRKNAAGGQSVRMAAMYRNALVNREEKINAAVAAYDRSETGEELIAAAGDLLAIAASADEEYRQKTASILSAMVDTGSGRVGTFTDPALNIICGRQP